MEVTKDKVVLNYQECLQVPAVAFDIYEVRDADDSKNIYTIVMNFYPREENDINNGFKKNFFSMTTGHAFLSLETAYEAIYKVHSYCFKVVDPRVYVFNKEGARIKEINMEKEPSVTSPSTTESRSLH